MVYERARSFCVAAIKLLDTELRIHSLDKSHIAIVFLVLQHVLELAMKNLNGHIALNDPGRHPLKIPDMLRCVSVLFLSSLRDITVEKVIEELVLRD